MISKTGILAGALLALACAPSASQARDFTIAAWGGAAQDMQRNFYFAPLAKQENIKVQEDVYLGGWGKFQSMVDSKEIVWDVINVETAELERGCQEGVFLKLDLAKFGRKASDFIPGAVTECGIGAYTFAFAVAYNADKVAQAPKSTADFFDLKTFPGRRGMRKGAHYNLEFALLADGVPPAEIYKTLSTEAGVARAFKKLDTIKSQIVWWEAPAQTTELVASGDVVMAVAPSTRIVEAKGKKPNLRLVFTPGLIGIDSWVVMKGSPFAETAYKFLAIATDAQQQAAWTNAYPMGPTVVAADQHIKAELKADMPSGPNIVGALNTSSAEAAQFWADRSDELNERWNAWLK